MSWTRVSQPYQVFEARASQVTTGRGANYSFPVTIWEVEDDTLQDRRDYDIVEEWSEHLNSPAQVRIIFAPLDEIFSDFVPGIIALCKALFIPHEFLAERLKGVCHSFGTKTDENGVATWFHYLCKAVQLEVRDRWHKSAFFLRKDLRGNVTLVCFGPTPVVRQRLEQCIQDGYWTDFQSEPLALFDLVLDGLFTELDQTVWALLDVIKGLENDVLAAESKKGQQSATDQIRFPELHDWAKHLININEVMESCLLIVDGTISRVGRSHPACAPSSSTPPRKVPVQTQLEESLQYRHSLFMSIKLRLNSLQKRVDNAITFAFNVVTQQDSRLMQHDSRLMRQDSRLMRQDSASMTIISFITMFFLPTAGVAAIIGSQLFVTEFDKANEGTSITYISPLFSILWWIAIPLTLVTTGVALYYRRFISADKQTGASVGSNLKWLMSLWPKANLPQRPQRAPASTRPTDMEMNVLPPSSSTGLAQSSPSGLLQQVEVDQGMTR